jgi:hypothetical protein
MTPHTKAACISGACLISAIAFVFIAGLTQVISGSFGTMVALASFLAMKVIFIVADIAFTVQGFRVHWGWGLANLILGPLAMIVFFIKHRQEGKVPIYIFTHALILLSIFMALAFMKV